MNERKLRKDIMIFFIFVIVLVSLIYFVSASDILKPKKINEELNTSINYASIKIICYDFVISYNTSNRNSITVADLLFECAEFHNISIEKKYWTGYDSYFIKSINNVRNGQNDCYWQYYINNEYSDVGCNNYFLIDQDKVEWRFEKSIWD